MTWDIGDGRSMFFYWRRVMTLARRELGLPGMFRSGHQDSPSRG
jgi:hypothetical protein